VSTGVLAKKERGYTQEKEKGFDLISPMTGQESWEDG